MLDRFGLAVEAVERGDRAEGLLLGLTMSVVTSVSTVGSKKLPPQLYVNERRRVCRR